jgi:nitrogen fixation/metabolism regulation signal transduction histidine kinase
MTEQKFKRRKFFINKRLQVRYMVSMLIPMLILIVFIGLVMYYSQYRFLQATTREMGKDLKNIILTNQMYVEDESERNAKSVAEIKEKLASFMVGEHSFSGSLLKTAYKILFLGLLVVIVELAFLTIFLSHKVAGPIYRLSKFAEDIRGGNFTSKIYLRQGDELTDVAMDFNRTSDFLCENFKRILDVNHQALEMLKTGRIDKDKIVLLEKELEETRGKIKLG